MELYVVIENGDPYPTIYRNYDDAVRAVKNKHREILEEDMKWLKLPQNRGEISIHEVDVPEAKKGPSILYIEKGIHIEIHKLPVQ